MKYIIPVVDVDDKKYRIAEGLNLSKFMCCFDDESENYTWNLSNEILPIGDKWVEKCKEKKIRGLILSSINSMAFNMFMRNGFEIYKSATKDVKEAVELLKTDGLQRFSDDDFGGTGCSGTCSTCESDDCSSENTEEPVRV